MMLAFRNTSVTKEQVIAQLKAHRAADEIIKGRYWENGKGCAVACTIHSADHAEYEPSFGIPRILARLEDSIFEGLPNEVAMDFPLRFIEAVQEGADLSRVGWQLLRWLLTDSEINPGIDHSAVRDAISRCANLVALAITAPAPETSEAAAAMAEAAWSAATNARNAAAVAPYPAFDAALSAADAADSVAAGVWSRWSAKSAAVAVESARAAASAAQWVSHSCDAQWQTIADKLVSLIEAAPIPDAPSDGGGSDA